MTSLLAVPSEQRRLGTVVREPWDWGWAPTVLADLRILNVSFVVDAFLFVGVCVFSLTQGLHVER